jgi:hypothetical protein
MVCYNNIYIILGAVAGLIGVMFMLSKTNIKEGFTDKNNVSDVVKNDGNKLSDTILVSKYRTAYEDTIINLENVIGLSMLNETINNAELISKNPVSNESMNAIANINNLKQFKETLNEVMVILDKTK